VVPHAPQFELSLRVSVHRAVPPETTVPQTCVPVGHEETHAPPAQKLPPGQSGTQEPAEHMSPFPHVVPQPPQLFGSFCVSSHWLPHWT
jgi:hypothetical protein